MQPVHRRFAELLASRYSILREMQREPDVQALVFPGIVDVPAAAIERVRELVRVLYALRELPLYGQRIAAADEEVASRPPRNRAVLMGYDFHLDAEGRPRLIEVNTNAAFSLGADLLGDCFALANPFVPSFLDALRASFATEFELARPGDQLETIAVIDENYRSQNYYFEFLMFKQLFERWGWRCIIGEPADFVFSPHSQMLEHASGIRIDLVYNRLTDFFLAHPANRSLRLAYLAGRTCFSPNPNEYALLADKQRLVEWSTPGWLESVGATASMMTTIREFVPRTEEVTPENAERLWSERRRWFFKPKRSFGSKGAFRGASISKRTFNEIVEQPYIAQAFVTPARVAVEGGEGLKFDLRFYAYRDAVQLMVGRVYQGQVTNLRTAGGGFAALRPIDRLTDQG